MAELEEIQCYFAQKASVSEKGNAQLAEWLAELMAYRNALTLEQAQDVSRIYNQYNLRNANDMFTYIQYLVNDIDKLQSHKF